MHVTNRAGLVGLLLFAACSAPSPLERDAKADLEAIERLHQKDARASREKDFDTLLTLITDDIVFMPPGEQFVRGKDAVSQQQKQYREELAEVEILEYRFEFEEVVVAGDYAFEWGTNMGRVRSADGQETEQRARLLRILKRQPDGGWKVHRAMWNVGAAAEVQVLKARGAGTADRDAHA